MEDVKLQEKIKIFLSTDDGSGYGSGYGICQIENHQIYKIDGIQTIICAVHNNVARGYILLSDLSLEPCFIVKGNGLFAHGKNLKEAMTALTDKMFDDMPEEERIAEFVKAHPDKKALYSHKDLYDWHHRLTGSCVAGRDAFAKDHGIDMEGSSTVEYFIELTQNAYGGSTIRKLAEAYHSPPGPPS
jgi:hypothetical protein